MIKLLIVEDSRTQAEQLRLILEAEGYRTEVAGDAEQAFARLRQTTFDLVISDILMPGPSGYELCRRMKADERTAKVPIILLTTLNDPMDIIQGLECGADNFITKPYEPDYLVARVRSFLDSRELRAARKLKLGVDVAFLGKTFTISSDKEQILDLLIATFEDIVRTNRKLQDKREELAYAKIKLEHYAARLEGRVQASEEQYRRLFETANDGILIADAETGTVVDANPGAAKLLGRPAAELFGVALTEFFLPGDADSMATSATDAVGAGAGRTREGIVRRADGTRIPVEVSANVFELNGKRLFQGTFRDISERTLLEQQLRHAQRMESIGQLTGGIAHDFNNLLGVTIGNLDLLIEEIGKDHHLYELADAALGGATRGADLVRRLLAFSRDQPLEPRVVDLNARLSQVAAMLRRTLDPRIEITIAPSDGLWTAFADPSQVEDAIMNLAINARDVMPDGGRLTLETANAGLDAEYAAQHSEVAPGDYVMFAVSDTGTGMPPEVVERAFEPFFTTKGASHGSGLGLSQVYGFVKQSGGHVKIYSELGHGTTVKVFLPRARLEDASTGRDRGTQQEASADGERQVVASAPSERGPDPQQELPRGRERILVAEDDADVRGAVVKQLKGLGYEVREAANGEEALALLDGGEVCDLLFTDILMPGGMTGWDLAREARQRRPEIRILLTSGYAQAAAHAQPRTPEEQNANLLSKPYRKRDLALAVRSILDRDS